MQVKWQCGICGRCHCYGKKNSAIPVGFNAIAAAAAVGAVTKQCNFGGGDSCKTELIG